MNGKTMSINREEILALTRRMTVKRTSMTRIAGCYADAEGFIDGTFNVNFLKLSPAEREKNLELAKTVPFAQTNQNLKRYVFPESEQGGMRQLLMGIRAWVKSEEYWPTRWRMLENIKLTLDENHIDIPYQQITVHQAHMESEK